jgi:endonuclease YncB( thermonuclease family)
MVHEGFAWFRAMRRHQYSRRSLAYDDAEREARAHHRGMWHPRTCNGEQRPA